MAKNKIIYNGNTLIDLTGDTVTADKLMQGYTAHDRSGVQITGTATQGGSVTQDQDGFIVLPPDGGGSPSVGGLVYETGTWTPTEDVARGEILFSNTHTVPPMYVAVSDSTGTTITDSTHNVSCAYIDFYRLVGSATDFGANTPRYGLATYTYRTGTGANSAQDVNAITTTSDSSDASSIYDSRYWATQTAFYPYCSYSTRYWKAGRTYKWIAVWAPTT